LLLDTGLLPAGVLPACLLFVNLLSTGDELLPDSLPAGVFELGIFGRRSRVWMRSLRQLAAVWAGARAGTSLECATARYGVYSVREFIAVG
jgi:hypothetical protein